MLTDDTGRPDRLPHRLNPTLEDAMVSLTTPRGPARLARRALRSAGPTDGGRHADSAAAPGTVVMFICNHCPYVKAVVAKIVGDMTELRPHGVGSIAIMSNDPAAYSEDSFDNMKAFAAQHGFTFPYVLDETQDVARAYGAVCTPDFFGFDGDPSRLPRPAGRVGALARPGGRPRTVRRHAVRRAYRQCTRRSASVGGLLDQVETGMTARRRVTGMPATRRARRRAARPSARGRSWAA
jgi:hypothetical protein